MKAETGKAAQSGQSVYPHEVLLWVPANSSCQENLGVSVDQATGFSFPLSMGSMFIDEPQSAPGGQSLELERISFSVFVPHQSGFPPPDYVLAKDTAAVT